MKQSRPPVVTLMGHVDHGKTTLLTAIKKSRMPKEAGNITQGIGASHVKTKDGRTITFIDTPGHAAFEKMRSRGASVADVVVLVVASDDGVKPQTVEAIKHIHAAKVPMLVAINKIDRPGANVDRVKQQLAEHGVLVEGYGGNVVAVEVSATKGMGMDQLLEMIGLVSEMQELQADPAGAFSAVVIESAIDAHRGPVATLIVQEGTLRVGMEIHAGRVGGKVRAMMNDRGQTVVASFPGTSVSVLGFANIPPVGAAVGVKGKDTSPPPPPIRRSIAEALKRKDEKTIPVVIKANVSGSLEVVRQEIAALETDARPMDIVSSGTGEIGESDVMQAAAAHAIIVGFRTRVRRMIKTLAERSNVILILGDVIYELMDALKEVIRAKEEKAASANRGEIVKVFAGKKPIAGVKVTAGVLRVDSSVVIRRGKETVGRSTIASMRHGKEGMKSTAAPGECGIILTNALDFQEGDTVES